MVKKLRAGLIEPSSIPEEDMMKYMSTTYSGYMTEIKERLQTFNHAKNLYLENGLGIYGYKFIDIEFYALQIRMIMELLAYAISTFEQGLDGKPKRNKSRNIYNPATVLKGSTTWFETIELHVDRNNSTNELLMKFIKLKYSDPKILFSDYGKLGNTLHAEQRPRTDGYEKLQRMELFQMANDIEQAITTHVIRKNGFGWVVDIRKPINDLGVSLWDITNFPQE